MKSEPKTTARLFALHGYTPTDQYQRRITIDPQICHGKPCIRGLRFPVTMILELHAACMSHEEILADYPDLEEEDIRACLQYAAKLRDVKTSTRVTA